MLDDLLEALGRVSEGITPEQRAAGKIAMAKAAKPPWLSQTPSVAK
jgi:hypothetical protein